MLDSRSGCATPRAASVLIPVVAAVPSPEDAEYHHGGEQVPGRTYANNDNNNNTIPTYY